MRLIIYAWILCFCIGKALIPSFGWAKLMGTSSNLPGFLQNETLLSHILRQLFHSEPVSFGLTIFGTVLCLRMKSLSEHLSKLYLSSTLLAAVAAHYLHIPVVSSTTFLFAVLTFVLLQKEPSGHKLTTLATLSAAIILTPNLNLLPAAMGSLPSVLLYAVIRRDAIQSITNKLFQRGQIKIPQNTNTKPIFRDCEIIDFPRSKAS